MLAVSDLAKVEETVDTPKQSEDWDGTKSTIEKLQTSSTSKVIAGRSSGQAKEAKEVTLRASLSVSKSVTALVKEHA